MRERYSPKWFTAWSKWEHEHSGGHGGCTWQQSPASHSIYFHELDLLGWNSTPYNFSAPNAHQPAIQTKGNIEIFRKAWQAKGLEPCGGNRI